MITKNELISGVKDRRVVALLAFTLLCASWMLLQKSMVVPAFMGGIVVVGLATIFWKNDNVKIAGLLCIVFLSLFSAYTNGLKFGIDFSGGVRIPILLEKPVDQATMDEMVQIIKTRSAAFGLSEVKVRPVGDSEIYVEVPQSNPQLVSDIERILSSQGVYQGIVDGKVAVSGDDILSGTIGRLPATAIGGADWGVSFTITTTANEQFSKTVKGKANYPLYMFLDRPSNAIVVLKRSELMQNLNITGLKMSQKDALAIASKSLRLEGDNVEIYVEEELDAKNLDFGNLTIVANKTKAVISNATGIALRSALKEKGFLLVEKPSEDMQPVYSISSFGSSQNTLNMWRGVGLLSAPRLSPDVTRGVSSPSYSITGAAVGTGNARLLDADKNAREVESILKGGALPVRISLGSATSVPAPLGAEFLRVSAIGAAIALIAISFMLALRYHTLKLVLPVMMISLAEIIVLVAILGSFTIDLAGMAGIIAAIGVSVDAQIVVTDELLKKNTTDGAHKKLEKAFSIIFTNVTVAIIAMVPLLLFSGLVEIIGFATSSILGSLLGAFISRPAYGAIAERLFDK
ncbi:Protein-export membrane protein SecD [Candidatus Anstonella stagnisolia]|nr:Protein-export membrane protein SecD [Candidatus Anstonella stagnisolia]